MIQYIEKKFIPWINGNPSIETILYITFTCHRNLANYKFLNNDANDEEKESLFKIISEQLSELFPNFTAVNTDELTEKEFNFLKERQIIPYELEQRAGKVGILFHESQSRQITILINHNDHLRLYASYPGRNILENFNETWKIQEKIDAAFDFASDDRWGYLTPSVNHLGTGFHITLLTHMPALLMTEGTTDDTQWAPVVKIQGTGFFNEDTVVGDLVKITTQESMGLEEFEIVANAIQLADQIEIIESDRQELILQSSKTNLKEQLQSATDILGKEGRMSFIESLMFVSTIRFAALTGILDIKIHPLTQLFFLLQPIHLNRLDDSNDELDGFEDLDRKRFRVLKSYLENIGWHGFSENDWF